MLGELAVFYLFLGGAGAGAVVVCALLDLIVVKESFGNSLYEAGLSGAPLSRMVSYGMLVGLLCLVVGALSLLFDLGRIDRAITLFTSPSVSLLTLGAFALVVLAACAAFLTIVRFVYLPEVARSLVFAVEIAAVVFGLVVMVYTGLLLQGTGGVAFWNSPLLPVLFLLSSASSGAALVFAAAFFVEADGRAMHVLRLLTRVDAVVIGCEALCALVFVLLANASDHLGVVESLRTLFQGEASLAWWAGFALCGLVAPLAIELALPRSSSGQRAGLALAAVLVLVGAFCLRWSLVEAGAHRAPVLEEVPATTAPFLNEAGSQVRGIDLFVLDGTTYDFDGHDITKTARMIETA
ncbi:NrfD/PsrC family molybdoenzyme membrane anchor subunit [Gordonibacter sp.]|uniref:NrfD/PsrC family molybdoenzyme membrane anchor subunit n=1 Tax=Gordonibacter sp. TaxID=1968902 RepID=UPI002FC7E30E